jgi:hypothetical protein
MMETASYSVAQLIGVIRRHAWVLVSIFVYFAITNHVIRQGIQPPLSPRYTLYAIPAAVSVLRGFAHDYSAELSIAALFFDDLNGDIDAEIRKALSEPALHDAGRWFVSGDDKGLIDLTYLSFKTFGPNIEGLLETVLTLIGLSAFLFILQFRREKSAMAALVSVLCGLYAVLFTFKITDQSTTIVEPRFLGVICIISSLHLMLTFGTERGLRTGEVILALLQSALIIFAIHLRSGELWQVFAIAFVSLSTIAFWRQRWRRPAVVMLILCSGIYGLGAYRKVTYNPHYFQSDISTRVFWHNLLLGLAPNPTLKREYGFSPLDDVSITEAVRRNMIADGRGESAATLYPGEDYAVGNFKNFDWGTYEVEARALYFKVIRDATWEVIKTYAIVAPTVFWQQIEVLSGRGEDAETVLPKQALRIASIEFRRAYRLHLSMVRPAALIAILASIALMALGTAHNPTAHNRWIAYCLVVLTVVSVAPAILATPVIQYSQIPLTLCLGLLYFVFVMVGAKLAMIWNLRSAT